MLRHARERAITTRQPHAVVVDPDGHRVSHRVGGADGEVRETRAPARAPRASRPTPPPALTVRFEPQGTSSGGDFRARVGHDRLSRDGGRPHRAGAERPRVSRPGRLHAARGAGRPRHPEPHRGRRRPGLRPGPAAAQALRRSPVRRSCIADQKAREVVVPKEGREEGTDGAFTWERDDQGAAGARARRPGPRRALARLRDQRAGGVGRAAAARWACTTPADRRRDAAQRAEAARR